jgi:hypothetical protein
VLLYPGSYKSFTCLDGVDIIGIGAPGAVVVDGAVLGAKCRIENVTFARTSGTGPCVSYTGAVGDYPFELVDCRSASAVASRVIVSMSGAGWMELLRCQFKSAYQCLEQSAGTVKATDCVFEEDDVAGTSYPVLISGGSQFEFRNCLFVGGGTSGLCLYQTAAVTTARLLHCTLRKGSAGTNTIDANSAKTVTIAGCLASHAASGDYTPADLVVDTGV